ncbi:hypothetical protein LFM41_08850, partial [Klebsiella pneumoniae]|uniref:hypothetical protein n=1 Tax=Klebsiella pneumoniae TaxID=573 RepID=UPI00207684DA
GGRGFWVQHSGPPVVDLLNLSCGGGGNQRGKGRRLLQMRQRMRGGCGICNSTTRVGCFQFLDFKNVIFYSPLA